MEILLEKEKIFVYTAAHEIDPGKPSVVFVHGAGLDHSSFGLQSRYFGYHGWNVLALDLPGHGRSAGPPLRSIGEMADWVVEVLDYLKIQKSVLVGHSMGSLISLEAAARHPERVDRIALIAVAYPMQVSAEFLGAAQKNDFAAFDMHTVWGHGAQAALGANPNPGMWMHGEGLARLRRLAPGVLYNDLKAAKDYVLSGSVKCPVLFILGKRDVMTPPRGAQALVEKLSNVKVEIAETSGHALMAEAPDATLDALIGFLQR